MTAQGGGGRVCRQRESRVQPWPRAARPERDVAAPGLASLRCREGAEVPEQGKQSRDASFRGGCSETRGGIYGRLRFHACFLRLKFCVSTPFPAERMSPTDILRLLTSFSDWLELHNLTRLTGISGTLWRRIAISNTHRGV